MGIALAAFALLAVAVAIPLAHKIRGKLRVARRLKNLK